MSIKHYKPTTPGRRRASVDKGDDLTKGKKSLRSLIVAKKKKSGRTHGKITVRHKGGGAKQYYRLIDFKRDRLDIPAKVESIERDPNRTGRIAQIVYEDGIRSYILAPANLRVGDKIVTSKKRVDIKVGNRTQLMNIPTGISVYNIELIPGRGAKLVRSAGLGAQLMAVEGKYAQLRLPSKEIRKVSGDCFATIGSVSFSEHSLIRLGKAGRTRHKGVKPTVRGKAMNPVDHPHGGGEGNQPIGMKAPKTPWGKKALGVKTRRKRRSNKLIVKRRK